MPAKDPRAYQKQRYDKRMAYGREKLGGKCVDCGATEQLHFDHISGPKDHFTVTDLANYSLAEFDDELSHCVLRCASCHRLRHASTAPHGTLARYQKCKCVDCRAANNKHAKEYKARRRSSMVEQRPHKAQDAGSSPVGGTVGSL